MTGYHSNPASINPNRQAASNDDIAFVAVRSPQFVQLWQGRRTEQASLGDSIMFLEWLDSCLVGDGGDFELGERQGALMCSCPILTPVRLYRLAAVTPWAGARVGYIRQFERAPFDEADLNRLWQHGGAVASVFHFGENIIHDRSWEAAALRSVGTGPGSLFIINVDRDTIEWTDADHETLPLGFEGQLIGAAKTLLNGPSSGHPPVSPRRIADALLVRAEPVLDPICEGANYAACRVQFVGRANHPLGMLSPRERKIAQLLTEGYSTFNVAAITGITEHTVRTYVRRIYRKFGICNRSELVRSIDASLAREREHSTAPTPTTRRDSGFVRVTSGDMPEKKVSG